MKKFFLRTVAAAAITVLASGPAFAAPPLIDLSWTLEGSEFTPAAPDGQTRAVLRLRNAGSLPLSTQGWSLYFTALSGLGGAPEGSIVPGGMRLEQVTGTLYRLRPAAGFPALAPGQSHAVSLIHPEVLQLADKAPLSPYVVEDARGDVAVPVHEYRVEPIDRRRLTLAPGDREPWADAEQLYRRYAAMQADTAVPVDDAPPVLPTPLRWQRGAQDWVLRAPPLVEAEPALAHEAQALQARLDALLPAAPRAGTIRLEIGPVDGQSSPEAYALSIDAGGAKLRGSSAAGVAAGLQSLFQLLPVGEPRTGVTLPALQLVDAPRFGYRGLMLDLARSYMGPAQIDRVLDLMARFKLNKLHLHLSDDEGWRLEIPALPELTAVGARRGHAANPLAMLPPAHGSGPAAEGAPGSGFLSSADFVALLKRAAALHIEVIPEFDLPGHARAAVVAMEARHARLLAGDAKAAAAYRLRDPADRSVYRSAQLYNDHLIDPGLESSYRFVETVVAEVAALYGEAGVPLRVLHLGGDEVPAGAWQRSPASQALMRRERLRDSQALWDYFFERVQRIVARRGIRLAGWEELGARKQRVRGGAERLAPNPRFAHRDISLHVWNTTEGSEDLGVRLANAGYPTVLASVMNLYLDMAQLKDPAEPGHNWATYLDLDQVFDYVPLDPLRRGAERRSPAEPTAALTPAGRARILGLEATLFSETVRSPQRADYMLMPRLLAVAERAWAADPAWATETDPARAARLYRADLARFLAKVGRQVLPRLDVERPDLAYRIAPPGLVRDGERVLVNYPWAGQLLRYTTDGSAPTADSPLVSGPIASRGPVRVTAFSSRGRPGGSSQLPAQP